MDTDKIVGKLFGFTEKRYRWMTYNFYSARIAYNPKLSDATPTTRVAYVKFMAKTMKKEHVEEGELAMVNEKKSILRTGIMKKTEEVNIS